MGEIADWLIDKLFDPYFDDADDDEDYYPRRAQTTKTCSRCGTSGLSWVGSDVEGWRLSDHVCNQSAKDSEFLDLTEGDMSLYDDFDGHFEHDLKLRDYEARGSFERCACPTCGEEGLERTMLSPGEYIFFSIDNTEHKCGG